MMMMMMTVLTSVFCVLQGMACVGRTKQCTLVPPNHFGPIPGVEVGSQWKFRVQVIYVGLSVAPSFYLSVFLSLCLRIAGLAGLNQCNLNH